MAGQSRQQLPDPRADREGDRHYQQALAIARETGNRGNEGAWLGNLGDSYRILGQTEKAIDHYQQALAIARETGDRGREGLQWAASATATRPWGRPRRRSSTTSRPWPSPAKPATATVKAGGWAASVTIPDPGADREGDRHYQQALAIARETGDRGREGVWLGGLGDIYRILGQTEKAIEHYQQALAIARETGNRGREGVWLGGLGDIYRILGQTEKAIEHYQQALAIARETSHRGREGLQLGGLGNSYATLGRPRRRSSTTSRPLRSVTTPGTRRFRPRPASASRRSTCIRKNGLKPGNSQKLAPSRGYRPVLAHVFAALGTAYLREGDHANADEAFSGTGAVRSERSAGRHRWPHQCAVREGNRQRRTGRYRQP